MNWKRLTAWGLGLLISLGSLPIQGASARQVKKHHRQKAKALYAVKKGMKKKIKVKCGKHRITRFQRASYIPRTPVYVSDRLVLGSASALVMDQRTGECLVQKSPDVVQPIASITKLMTAMVVLDAKLDLNESITIQYDDVDTMRHSRSKLPVGTALTRREALELALTASENRAAHALGRHYPGGIKAFVAAMNAKAVALGLKDARFADPTGLSEFNVASAKDLAHMVDAAHRYSEIRAFSTLPEVALHCYRRPIMFRNTNALIRSDEWEIGLSKTGFINEAGRCLVMQAVVANRPLLIVLLDSAGSRTRTVDANRIKHWVETRLKS